MGERALVDSRRWSGSNPDGRASALKIRSVRSRSSELTSRPSISLRPGWGVNTAVNELNAQDFLQYVMVTWESPDKGWTVELFAGYRIISEHDVK